MIADTNRATGRQASRWRVAGWGLAGLLLLLPFVAMQVSSEWNWDAADFVTFGLMLGAAGVAMELAVRISRSRLYRAAFGIAVFAGFLLIWANLAVGILGGERNPANLMFAGVLCVAAVASLAVRFQARGMAMAMLAAAAAQLAVGVIALAAGLASQGRQGVYEVMVATTLFGGLWLLSAGLFRRAASGSPAGR